MALNHDHYMTLAIEDCRSGFAGAHGGPFGAAIIRGAELLSLGHNTVMRDNDPTAHAEINAIRDAGNHIHHYDLTGCTLYCVCEPCPMCLGAIYWARINTLYYGATKSDSAKIGFDDVVFYAEFAKPETNRKIASHQLLIEETLSLLKEYNDIPDKQIY